MQSYWMQMTDTDTVLELRESPVPEPGPRQLLVRMHAAALNRGEFLLGHGLHGKPGTLEGDRRRRCGRGRRRRRRGHRLQAGRSRHGPLRRRVFGVRADGGGRGDGECRPSLSWEEAASIPLTFLVAYDMLVLQGRLKRGEWLLINGVSSGVGVASLQLGKVLGAKRHRHFGLGRQAGGAQAARPRRRAVHARARLRALR